VVKTHQLTYSSSPSFYAVFDRKECSQHFIIQSKVAKEYLDHFQPRIEEIDIYADEDRLIWNGYTEGFIGDENRNFTTFRVNKETLKQPLQTQVSLSTAELEEFQLERVVHIHISLRDFKVLKYPLD
jgi:cell cycle checkpoint control protein RAD9A